MKITRIALQGFRAFDEAFQLDLASGKNLLLHGENGSGKSPLHLALKQFFEEHGGDIAASRNISRSQAPACERTPAKLQLGVKTAA